MLEHFDRIRKQFVEQPVILCGTRYCASADCFELVTRRAQCTECWEAGVSLGRSCQSK